MARMTHGRAFHPPPPLQRYLSKPVTGATKSMMNMMRIAPTGPGSVSASSAVLPTPKFDGQPPMGYLWLWMGGFMRWRRRFIVVGEAPGVVLIYKRMNMKGKIWSISLKDASVHQDEADVRQLKIVTTSGLIFLRTNAEEQRNAWLACLGESIALYLEKQQLVEGLQDQGLLSLQVAVPELWSLGGWGCMPASRTLERLLSLPCPP